MEINKTKDRTSNCQSDEAGGYAFFKDKIWCDLKGDREKALFLKSGRAVQTGIVAPGLVDELATLFTFRAEHKA